MSFEHEIENNKKNYYRALRSCQAQRPEEDITDWIDFFLESLINVQTKLQKKLEIASQENTLSPKEKSIYMYISNHENCKSKDITETLEIPKTTLKRILVDLLAKNLILKSGKGAGVSYSTI